jgi:translocation and assembly module TamB
MQPRSGAPPALAGRLYARLSVDGRWPALATRGTARLAEARFEETRLARLNARWRFQNAPAAPLELHVEASDLAAGAEPQGPRIAKAQLNLEGSLAEHRIALDASSPARPPAWVETLQETKASAQGSALELRAQGSLAGLGASAKARPPLQWRGTVQRLELRPLGNAGAPPWLATSGVGLVLSQDPAVSVEVAPGRVQGPSGTALRWSALRWKGGAQPALEAHAELEPIEVAPLLARLQPDFGWRGDLALAGHIDIRSAPRVEAAIEIVRSRGDLSVSETSTTALALGLTDLRLALDAHDGVWSFTGAFAGKTLGAAAAAVTARTGAEQLWPPAQAPLSGVLEATVANLGAWGAWVPAGWRLGGRLHASASIGGRFGAPLYTGRIEGRELSARNLLDGVDVHDGDLALALEGETARIERFGARAGEGRIDISGGASFGTDPRATLKVVADRLRVLGRVDRRIVASGQAEVRLASRAIDVAGGFKIDEGLIDITHEGAPKLGSDVHVIRPEEAQAKGAQAAGSAASPLRLALDLGLDLGQQLHLRGRGIDTLLRGELKLTSPGDKLAVAGTIRTAEGHYAAYGQKLDIDRGLIVFTGAIDNPRLDILAVRPDIDVRVGVAISGSAQAPRVRLFSEPDMAEIDKLSWLVLGHASAGAGGSDLALLQHAALGLLQGEGNGAGSGLTQRLGLDDLSLRQGQTPGQTGDVKETIVSLGKQLTQRWYVGYERGLSATAGTWQLIYRIAQRFTLRAQSGLDNSLDLIWTWRWQ